MSADRFERIAICNHRTVVEAAGDVGLAQGKRCRVAHYRRDEGAAALNVQLTDEDVSDMKAFYVPHPVVGAVNANPPQGTVLLDEKK